MRFLFIILKEQNGFQLKYESLIQMFFWLYQINKLENEKKLMILVLRYAQVLALRFIY